MVALAPAAHAQGAADQWPGREPGTQGSSNITVLSHIPLGRMFSVANIDMEQELSRPYVYVSRMLSTVPESGFDVIDIRNPEKAAIRYSWRIENGELHEGSGCLSGKYFKLKGRYYYAQGPRAASSAAPGLTRTSGRSCST
jgi:hypothetical protein